LGLSAVDGNVARHHGWIEVDSTVGKGTEFRIFLPTTTSARAKQPATSRRNGRPGTILVVEDEDVLLELVQRILELHGHRVLTATSGTEALKIWEANSDTIDLLLTDMVMPGGMSGHELAVQLLQRAPHLKVIYTSGYSRDVFGKNFPFEEGINFLTKPYNILTMVKLVNDNIASAKEAVN
jgi:CheY-like chemotaxis protein